MKYKVLIADDEYWTREKIKRMIPWQEYSLELLEPAQDGEEVLEKIAEEKPDILITDINMPFLNGVELLNRIKEMEVDIITFVVSGYDDFEYVRDTFLAGSINYLLKPVSKTDLVNALSKALELLSKKEEEENQEEKRKMELQKASSLIQDREFSRLLEKKQASFQPDISMNRSMDFAGASLVLIKIHSLKELAKEYEYDMSRLSYAVKRWMKDILSMEELFVFQHIYRSNEFIILAEQEKQTIWKMAEQLRLSFAGITKSPVTVVISDHCYTMEQMNQAYVQTVTLLMKRRYVQESVILSYEKERAKEREEIKSRFDEMAAKELKNRFKRGQKEDVKKLIFETAGLSGCSRQRWGYLEVKQTVKRMLNSLSACIDGSITAKESIELESMMELADNVVETLDAEALCEIMDEIIEYVMQMKSEELPESIQGVVKQAVAFINENYFESLTLSSLAGQFHVESSYFSRLFRKETGDNLILYITKLRIEKAKEYMKANEINLTEIAFMVGYDDYTYFNRVFKKITGMSPRDFKAGMQKT